MISSVAPAWMFMVPEMFRRSLPVGAISSSRFEPLVNSTLPLTVIVPGEAPGDSVPRTSILAFTVPAVPNVAPWLTTMVLAEVMVVPACPIRRPPVTETVS